MRTSTTAWTRDRNADAEGSLRREAMLLLAYYGPRLIKSLRDVAGEDGLALGFAFRDIVMDQDMPPSTWPVTDVLDLLAREDAGASDTASLAAALSALCLRIDALEDHLAYDEAAPLPVDRAA